ncbi:uncharacterized protein LOC135830101 [Sycon ciliatum]|uniref:uncharacterized protein LOC135830101 n=1 Tax=Sycon ciliatum TaxID=27933 RepID=UPI0031F66F03
MVQGCGWHNTCLLTTMLVAATLLPSGLVDAYKSCQYLRNDTFDDRRERNGWIGFGTDASEGWTLTTTSPPGILAPRADHSSGLGLYAYINTAQLLTSRSSSQYTLKSPTLSNPNPYQGDCYVSFYYSMNGQGNRTLELYEILQPGPERLLWAHKGSQCTNGGWTFAEARIPTSKVSELVASGANSLASFAIGFAVLFSHGIDTPPLVGDIALDDINIRCCSGCAVPSILSTATFESSSNGFTSDPTGDLSFQRHRGPGPNEGTGPAVDHTIGHPGCQNSDGHYFFVDSSFPRPSGRASLLSPTFAVPGLHKDSVCFLSLFLSLYGTGISRNTIEVITGNSVVSSWTINGDRTDANSWFPWAGWFSPTGTFQINVTVELGFHSRSDVAVDDVHVSCCRDSCHHFQTMDFEGGDNSFTAPNGSDPSWFRLADTEGGGRFFPHNHVLQTSLYVQTSTPRHTTSVTLALPFRDDLEYHCRTKFLLFIDYPRPGAVEVQLARPDSDSSPRVVWTLGGQPRSLDAEETFWFNIAVNVSRQFKLTWFANPAGNTVTTLKLDRIQVACCPMGSEGAITQQPTVPPTSPAVGEVTSATAQPTLATPATPFFGSWLSIAVLGGILFVLANVVVSILCYKRLKIRKGRLQDSPLGLQIDTRQSSENMDEFVESLGMATGVEQETKLIAQEARVASTSPTDPESQGPLSVIRGSDRGRQVRLRRADTSQTVLEYPHLEEIGTDAIQSMPVYEEKEHMAGQLQRSIRKLNPLQRRGSADKKGEDGWYLARTGQPSTASSWGRGSSSETIQSEQMSGASILTAPRSAPFSTIQGGRVSDIAALMPVPEPQADGTREPMPLPRNPVVEKREPMPLPQGAESMKSVPQSSYARLHTHHGRSIRGGERKRAFSNRPSSVRSASQSSWHGKRSTSDGADAEYIPGVSLMSDLSFSRQSVFSEMPEDSERKRKASSQDYERLQRGIIRSSFGTERKRRPISSLASTSRPTSQSSWHGKRSTTDSEYIPSESIMSDLSYDQQSVFSATEPEPKPTAKRHSFPSCPEKKPSLMQPTLSNRRNTFPLIQADNFEGLKACVQFRLQLNLRKKRRSCQNALDDVDDMTPNPLYQSSRKTSNSVYDYNRSQHRYRSSDGSGKRYSSISNSAGSRQSTSQADLIQRKHSGLQYPIVGLDDLTPNPLYEEVGTPGSSAAGSAVGSAHLHMYSRLASPLGLSGIAGASEERIDSQLSTGARRNALQQTKQQSAQHHGSHCPFGNLDDMTPNPIYWRNFAPRYTLESGDDMKVNPQYENVEWPNQSAPRTPSSLKDRDTYSGVHTLCPHSTASAGKRRFDDAAPGRAGCTTPREHKASKSHSAPTGSVITEGNKPSPPTIKWHSDPIWTRREVDDQMRVELMTGLYPVAKRRRYDTDDNKPSSMSGGASSNDSSTDVDSTQKETASLGDYQSPEYSQTENDNTP